MAAADFVIASPNGSTWSIQKTNAAVDGRYHDLGFYSEGASGAGNVFTAVRSGILAGPVGTTGTHSPGAFAVLPNGLMTWKVDRGNAIIDRGTKVGPYGLASYIVGTGAVDPADPSLTRVDRLDLQMFDGAQGDNSSTSVSRVHVTKGTPGSGVPAAPSVPGGSTPLGWWSITAGATALTTAMWTPARKSAALRGTIRMCLEGDALSDPGFDSGELRDTTLISTPATIDRWNPTSGSWDRLFWFSDGGWVTDEGIVGGQYRVTSTGNVAGTETTVVSTGSLSLEANSTYMVEYFTQGSVSATGIERWTQRIRLGTLTGTTMAALTIAPNSDAALDAVGGYVRAPFVTTSAQSATFLGTFVRASNTNGTTWAASSSANCIIVKRIGSSSLLSSV